MKHHGSDNPGMGPTRTAKQKPAQRRVVCAGWAVAVAICGGDPSSTYRRCGGRASTRHPLASPLAGCIRRPPATVGRRTASGPGRFLSDCPAPRHAIGGGCGGPWAVLWSLIC